MSDQIFEMISKTSIQALLCQGPVIASVNPGDWMFTKKVLPSGENVAPANSERFIAFFANLESAPF